MKRILYIVLGLSVLSAFAAGCGSSPAGNSADSTIMLRPHEELPDGTDEKDYKSIFLAGTIDMGNSRDWQQEVYSHFRNREGRYLLYNPRQTDWDASRPGEMDYQVNWELEHLEKADRILMYILGSSKSPISLLEMGLHMRSGKMTVVCETEYYRYDNVRITCAFYGVPLYATLDEVLQRL